MAQVEKLYLQVMLPVSIIMIAAIVAFNVALERRIQAKVTTINQKIKSTFQFSNLDTHVRVTLGDTTKNKF